MSAGWRRIAGSDPRPAPLHGPGHPQDAGPGAQGFVGDREHRQPPPVAQARPHAEDHPHDRESKVNKGGLRSLTGRGRRGGSRHLYPTLAQQVLCCSMFCCASARVGASVPKPHATSPSPAALAHAARARRRRPAAQCPAPTAAWVTTGMTADTHSSVPEGLAPSRTDIKTTRRNWALPSSRAIPALSPRRRGSAKLPGCRHPGRCRPAGPGRRCPGPTTSALAPRRSSTQAGSPGTTAGPVSAPAPRADVPRTGDSSSNPGDPIHYELNLGKAQGQPAHEEMAQIRWQTIAGNAKNPCRWI